MSVHELHMDMLKKYSADLSMACDAKRNFLNIYSALWLLLPMQLLKN